MNTDIIEGNKVSSNTKCSAFGYWVICTQSYEIDGTEISKGRMNYHTSIRPIMSTKWRKATQNEIETRQYFKGNCFNLKNV